MPELPEVQTVVNTLADQLLGCELQQVLHVRPDIVTPNGFDLPRHLEHRHVTNIRRRGKRIVFTLDDGDTFYIHLGMTGRLTIDPAETPIPPHTHLIIALHVKRGMGVSPMPLNAHGRDAHATQLQLRFRDARRFGGIWWLGHEMPEEDMGPEPLTLRPSQLARRLSRTTRAIKNALLDQRVIAGLGNIYVDESLFAARVHPLTPANKLELDDIRRLNRAIKQTLRRALRHRGSTLRDYVDANGDAGAFQRLHKVYDREGEPCPTCKTKLIRIVLGGRSTCFCPHCQKLPAVRRLR